jgi:hypothetical protein
MGPRKKFHARDAQTNAGPAQPIRRAKCKPLEPAALKAQIQEERGEQQQGQICDEMRQHALALTSSVIRRESLPVRHTRNANQDRIESIKPNNVQNVQKIALKACSVSIRSTAS